MPGSDQGRGSPAGRATDNHMVVTMVPAKPPGSLGYEGVMCIVVHVEIVHATSLLRAVHGRKREKGGFY